MQRLSGQLVTCLLLIGCGVAPTAEEFEEKTEALVCPPVSNTNINRSLVVTDPQALAKFGFARTFNQLRARADAGTQSNQAVFQSLVSSFAVPGCTNIDPNGYDVACPRQESLLSQTNPFASNSTVLFEPLGLFNRFDLAAANGSTCGEYRIVYGMRFLSGAPINGRAFIIFEGAIPNPGSGVDGCLPVARFWQGLSTDGNAASRATKLERFYYLGTAVAGLGPVVDARNYGLGGTRRGQVRTNFFINNAEWQLREFKFTRTCTSSSCTLRLGLVPVKENPGDELFTGTHPLSNNFRTTFLNNVPLLASSSLASIAMANGSDSFNSAESGTRSLDVFYDQAASNSLRSAVQTRLGTASTLTAANIFARATTQTCAGCHQLSNGAALGGSLVWPPSAGFVHITEQRQLSPALTQVFLPRRRQVLESFINARCTGSATVPAQQTAAAPEDGVLLTVGGAPFGSAN